MLTEDDVREALRACYDGVSRFGKAVNVVDLGMVEGIKLTVDAEAPGAGVEGVPVRQALRLKMVAVSEDEDARAMLEAQIRNRLGGVEGLSRIGIEFAAGVVWTEARITPEGRRLLGLDARVFPILNNRR